MGQGGRCGGDENRLWNNLLQFAHPDLKIKQLEEDLEWEKLMLWEAGGAALTSSPQPLSLSGRPKASLVRSKRLLTAHMTADELRNLRLGAGTALAMRWNQRLSTDIDYAMERQLALAFINRTRQALSDDLREGAL